MKKVKLTFERKYGDYGIEVSDEMNHIITTDSSSATGGNDAGFRPMQLVLAGLGSCSAIDVVSILKKQRQQIDSLKIEIEGEREEGKVPSLWKNVHLLFVLKGDFDAERARKAVALSVEKYCSVAETLRRGGTVITWDITVEQTETSLK